MNSQAAKRYACDRCREQKLKCSRSQPADNSACERCLRLGAECATGSGRPLGRPPLHTHPSGSSAQVATHSRRASRAHRAARTSLSSASTTQGHHQQAQELWIRAVVGTGGSTSPAGNVEHATNIECTANPQAPLPSVPPPAQTQSQSQIPFQPQPCGAESSQYFPGAPDPTTGALRYTGQCEISFPTPSNSSLEGSTTQPWYEYNGVKDLDFGDLDIDFGDVGAVQDMNESFVAHSSTQTTSDVTKDHGRSQQSITPGTSGNGDSMVFVMGMLTSIAPKLAELKNQPWETWNPHNHTTRAAFFHGPDLTGSRDVDLWDNTLSVITRFAMVTQMMKSASFRSLTAPPITLPMTLVLLSTYIQLAELITIILSRINCCMEEGEGDGSRPGVPTVATAHYLTHPPNVQTMMMMQMLEFQLQTVERLMGLPDRCRIWGHGNVEPGLLTQVKSTELVQAVMDQAGGTFQSLTQIRERIQTNLQHHHAS